MATSRTPVSKKTTTTKKAATAVSATLPASKTKAAAPKTRAKPPSPSAVQPASPKQEKLTLNAAAPGRSLATKKSPAQKTVSPEERYQMIAAAAYFLAERHGFTSNRAMDDWIAAEKEIDGMLKSGH